MSDAFIVAGDWISEHYFGTDAKKESFQARVLAQRAAWEEQRDDGTPRTRLTSQRQELLRMILAATGDIGSESGGETAPVAALTTALAQVFGYGEPGQATEQRGPVTLYRSAGLQEPVVAVVRARACETVEALLAKDDPTLIEPYEPEDSDPVQSVGRLLSALFVGHEPRPAFALVFGGRWAVVAERERWPEGRYLAVDLQLVLERADDRRGGELDRALCCVAASSLVPDAEGTIWWSQVLEESVRHTVGVSKDLREGIRLSIEIIGNEVVRRRAARGLPELTTKEDAQDLARQALRFLYRILFLLYAEASPELGVVPTGSPEYGRGYSLDRLRDLTQVELATPHARDGTHLYGSLSVLFQLVDGQLPEKGDALPEALPFRSMRADLFQRKATAFIDEVELGNASTQRVLQHLLLSKATAKKDRGFISYAELGINQLGAVYEGLMSYTGSFAARDLHELAKNGDAEKGSWVVPVEQVDEVLKDHLVTYEDEETGEVLPVTHERGAFVFRLSGRDREQSASYYTPEVLTRFVVSQSLEELLDQGGVRTTAEEILELTVCEPALGSGAFAIEAVRQLAEQYLQRRQEELGESIDPEEYPRELQRVKAYLALHQTYGVDLNPTAIELAEISLWLDTMVEDLQAPWFGLHLRRGNSLIGAQRAVYSKVQLSKGTYLKGVPIQVGEATEQAKAIAGYVPHFLVPAMGWGAAADVAKDIAGLAPAQVKALKDWRKQIRHRLTTKQVNTLVDLGHRVERLWQLTTIRLEIAESQVRRDIRLWGCGPGDAANAAPGDRVVTREEIEEALADADGSYQRLRRVMDAWCALWFWPLTESSAPPTIDEWLDALVMLLGHHKPSREKKGQLTIGSGESWDALGDIEVNDRVLANARTADETLTEHPWLHVCEKVAARQGFFHWALDFAPVFERRGGFDLQVGNPPWVRPTVDAETLLAEGDPWWALALKPTQEVKKARRGLTLQRSGMFDLVVDATVEQVVGSAYLGWAGAFPHLGGLQPNLYRCFMEKTWAHQSPDGITTLVHPESHFTDDKAGPLRAATYSRLRRHWQFVNELKLFEVHHQVWYGVHVYGPPCVDVSFKSAAMLYHPETVNRSVSHDGSGIEPGLKGPDGDWDLRPHARRILNVDETVLSIWHDLIEDDDTPLRQSRQVTTVSESVLDALIALTRARRIGELSTEFSAGWHESADRQRGRFDVEWGPARSWDEAILQGPHLFVGTPFYKSPNSTMLHKTDWSPVDLETLAPDATPITAYKPRGESDTYDARYTHWGQQSELPARRYYRLAWRAMAANTNERTLISSIIPPKAAHVDGIFSASWIVDSNRLLCLSQAITGSLLADFVVRAAPKSTIRATTFRRLPLFPDDWDLEADTVLRVLRMNCATDAYAELWQDALPAGFGMKCWTGGLDHPKRRAIGDVDATWTPDSFLRRASDRRQALLELDALVALGLGVSIDQLCTIYRSQFPVLYGYDRRRDHYDANGRLVPNAVLTTWRLRGEAISHEERTHTNASGNTYVYELPYVTLDREADMRKAYAHFEQLLEDGDG